MPTKEEIELETLKRNSPYALPDDTAASGWTSAQVKEKFYAGLLYLYDLFKTYRDSVGGDVGEIADKVDALTEEIEGFIANESATTDDEGNVIKTTYAKIAAIEGGTVAAAKYIKADSTRENIHAIEPRIMAIIAVLQGYFTNGKANVAALADKAVADGSGQNIEQTYEKKGSIAGLQASINGILNGTSTVGKALSDGSGNPISTTYETKADALSKVSAANLRTAIGLATTSLAGLMGPEDKSRLDALYALLNSDEDADEVVNTINEVLAVFDQYPEGVSLANALALKVDKIAGKGLSTEDYTSAEKTKLQGIENGAQVNEVTSVAGKTGAVTLSKSDVGLNNVDNTSDLNKPISTATQGALDLKADKATTYTKSETDALLAPKANSADVYTKTTIDSLLSAKANSSDVYTKTAADSLLSAKANSADVYTKAQVDSAIAGAGGLPTITIALSQVISQDPLQIQLTNEQYAIMNGHSVLLDASALGMPAVVANFNGQYTEEDVTYQSFVFSYNTAGVELLAFKTILINPSTKVAEVGDTRPHRANHADVANLAVEAQQADSVTYLDYAPTSANIRSGALKIVVLSSEPATRYDGYLYIITGSN